VEEQNESQTVKEQEHETPAPAQSPQTAITPSKQPLHSFIRPDGVIASEEHKLKIAELVSKGKADIHAKNIEGKTVLALILDSIFKSTYNIMDTNIKVRAWIARIDDAMFLIRYGANPDTRDEQGRTLLFLLLNVIAMSRGKASDYCNLQIVKLITQHKADIGLQYANETPLQFLMTCRKFDAEDALLLVSLGADPNSKTLHGGCLLKILVGSSRLLQPGNKIAPRDKQVIIQLVTRYQANINLPNAHQKTPLHAYIDQDQFDAEDALFLVRYGADPNSLNSKSESLLFRVTHEFTSPDIIKELILDHRAEIDQKTLLDSGRCQIIAKILFEAWLVEPVEKNKDYIDSLLIKLKAQLKTHDENPKATRSTYKSYFHLPFVSQAGVDIRLDYYVNSLQAFGNFKTRTCMINDYIATVKTLTNLNPVAFVELFKREFKILTDKKDADNLKRREPFLKTLMADKDFQSCSCYSACQAVIAEAYGLTQGASAGSWNPIPGLLTLFNRPSPQSMLAFIPQTLALKATADPKDKDEDEDEDEDDDEGKELQRWPSKTSDEENEQVEDGENHSRGLNPK
jgi:hypothetical protein